MIAKKIYQSDILHHKIQQNIYCNTFLKSLSNSSYIYLNSWMRWFTMSGTQDFDESKLPEHLLSLKPSEPNPEDCCGNGCKLCVYDIYEQELKIWRKECLLYLGHTSSELSSLKVPVILPDSYTLFKIVNIFPETKDCNIYRFSVPENRSLNLKLGEHLILRGKIDKNYVCRAYTPVSPLNSKGYFDLLIKIYGNGLMSRYISKLKLDDEVELRGPLGDFEYKPNEFKKIFLVAAGTGITPMISLIQTIVENEGDETFVRLLYSCRTYDDIILQKPLNHFKSYWNFTVRYFLSQELNQIEHYGEDIHYGRIDKSILHNEICDNEMFAKNCKVIVCGPLSFNNDMKKYLSDIFSDKNKYFVFQ